MHLDTISRCLLVLSLAVFIQTTDKLPLQYTSVLLR